MSDGPTSAVEPPDAAALARAGWREAELVWEHVQVAAAEALASGNAEEAAEFWRTGLALARETFAADDPRLAASLANHAAGQRHAGDEAQAVQLIDEALAVWDRTGPWIAALEPERRARSSLFHLRLEAKHKGAYEHHSEARYTKLAEEGRARTLALKEPTTEPAVDLDRWHRDRPAGYTDARKLLGAVLLQV